MKKVSALLLTAMLGTSMVFASFTGNASLSTKYDTESKDFVMENSSSLKFDVDLLNQKFENANSDKAVYAKINATLRVAIMDSNHEDGIPKDDPLYLYLNTTKSDPVTMEDGSVILGVGITLDTAAIMGDNWSLDITGLPDGPDYAVSTIDSKEIKKDRDGDWGFIKATYDDYFDYEPGYKKAPGFTFNYGVAKLGLGYKYVDGTGTDATVYVGADDYQVADGLMFSGAVAYSQNRTADDAADRLGKSGAAGLKLAYTADEYTATIASDFGYNFDDEDGDADVSANVTFDPFTVDAYYATKATTKDPDDPTKDLAPVENLLSVQVATDLNAYDMPLVVTLSGKDLVNAQALEAKFAYSVSDSLTLTTTGDYTIDTKAWKAKVEAEYMMAAVGTIKGSVSYADVIDAPDDTAKLLAMSASVENKTLVDNATLSLKWEDANDMLKKNSGETDFGTITAKCEIAF